MPAAVRAVLWDADGVLQHTPDGWFEALRAGGGPGFAEDVLAAEAPAVRGEAPLRDTLVGVLARRPDATVSLGELLSLWELAEVDADALGLVAEVRARGLVCALATNQHDHRRSWMRDGLGLDRHFDAVFYSAELGVAKPEPAYFHRVLADLGLGPGEVVFVDDSRANVDAAASVGIRSVRHDPASGASVLRAEVEALLRP
ncbi:HAD-IA family hydrolase [Phycicoccus endophyticus]|uniref:HAD-IA family hydrolase n=1 Tax=Phycicoccus endophyticus TaxID=1690220 RepID=A0A7G9R467_9MICO|nr:HAD-IA family hydrolase [Phycicoccus endophyticus]NHI18241.1 HAD-IA family hydrolase [Phycicoccus endophyticus]QNN50392.1 HAD-IA family hydrolase [Phycicoccus endophyticus]